MKAVVQRVQWAEVEVEGRIVGSMRKGLLVYVGVARGDNAGVAVKLADKVVHLRIFPDAQQKLNCSVQDAAGGVLAVPNFTLLADAGKGRRPALTGAAEAGAAGEIFSSFVSALAKAGCPVSAGIFGADMIIRSAADGPVNILLELDKDQGNGKTPGAT